MQMIFAWAERWSIEAEQQRRAIGKIEMLFFFRREKGNIEGDKSKSLN